MMPRARLNFVLYAVIASALAACGSTPDKQQQTEQRPAQQPGYTLSPEDNTQLPASEFNQQFANCEQTLTQFDVMAARSAITGLSEQELTSHDQDYLLYLQARINFLTGDIQNSNQQLRQLSNRTLHPALNIKVLSFQRHQAALSGDYLGSARLAMQLLQFLPSQSDNLQRQLWRNLQRVPVGELRTALDQTTDADWYRWLDLALISHKLDTGPTGLDALRQWQNRNPSQQLPGGFSYLLAQSQPAQDVALLLPLTGRLAPAAQAVRDGYLSAFYSNDAEAKGRLNIYDTNSFDNATAAYNAAVANGAGLVIGPLSKQSVVDIGLLPDRSVPVLTLNRIEQPIPPSRSALVQLSLAPEDEAERIAELAFGQGARRALIVRPEGEWGAKMERALRQSFQPLGGTIAATAQYQGSAEYSDAIKASLNINASEQRARQVRSMLATNIEFTARRRQDVDVIFLLCRSGAEARSIKPLLAYHYAGTLPVWGTSSLYSGAPDQRDRDLDGIKLVEIPWLLGASPDLRQDIAKGGTDSDNYTRLNALGADAYLLQTRFTQLQAGPDALIRGNTGLLSMDPELRLKREAASATFDGGVIKPQ